MSFDLYLPLAGVSVPWPWLVLLGLSIGVLQGFFGVGGGWLTTPALNILGLPIVYAIGTDLAYTAGSAMIGSLRHFRLGNLELRLAVVLGLSGMAGMEAARRFVLHLESQGLAEGPIRLAYIALLLWMGATIVIGYLRGQSAAKATGGGAAETEGTRLSAWVTGLAPRPGLQLAKADRALPLWAVIVIGVVVGTVAGFLGVGGGFLMVPALVYVLGLPTRVAVASSLFSIVLSNSYGAVGYGLAGRVELLAAGIMFLGANVGAWLGATATVHVRGKQLELLLGITLVLAGIGVLLRQLELSQPAAVLMFGTAFAMTLVILTLLVRGSRLAARQSAP